MQVLLLFGLLLLAVILIAQQGVVMLLVELKFAATTTPVAVVGLGLQIVPLLQHQLVLIFALQLVIVMSHPLHQESITLVLL